MSSRIWFITGTSRGFGREWALAALERMTTALDKYVTQSAAQAPNPES